mmetsp:Transcript_38371/g.105693  ORF Transcript_38371/g.105693 Transcript_38371/m.105693 type:complete len:746 (-) Transcript_38371:104-2341(-)
MLVCQLKNSRKPLQYGEFTPLRERTKDDCRSKSALGRYPPSGVVSGRTSTSCGPRGDHGDSHPERPASRGNTAKLAKGFKVFSNHNSYRGTLLEGRMHGEGLYTWSDGAKYAGEFREGFMWGQGEKCWPNGRKYRGEWARDMMWGDGEMTWPSGETFTGQFRKGIFHGRGTRVWPSGDWYAGEFVNGEQEGEGTFESSAEGWVYNGRWLHGRMFGEGRVEWPNSVAYKGEWNDGIREGHGRLTWPDGSWYEGQFCRNCIEGRGRKALPDGSWFDGHFHDGELTGTGTFHWADGTEFEGLWHNSEIVGPGCHRFPDDTTITGVFEDRGASGEGTKKWANGCSYTGTLLRNQVHRHGVLKWPDGRCYHGHFRDETMHGEGILTWSDKDGTCRYRGCFENNAFHGHGVLDWSNKARYQGEFRDGLYHGEGIFRWPDKLNVYRGQWERGEMSGRGVLTSAGELNNSGGDAFVYVGEFCKGHMQGQGCVTFPVPTPGAAPASAAFVAAKKSTYRGEFSHSMFHGLGTFTWASGHSLSGRFQQNTCCHVGCKVYPGGQMYYGELENDLEHGKGVLMDNGTRLIGLWKKGQIVEELFETFVPALDLDAIEGDEWQKVFGGFREAPEKQEQVDNASAGSGKKLEDGEAIWLYLSGDRYVGRVRQGKKHGLGMYVYADLSSYKGQWSADTMGGIRHPLPEKERSEQVVKLHKLNEEYQSRVESLKAFVTSKNASRDGSPPVVDRGPERAHAVGR